MTGPAVRRAWATDADAVAEVYVDSWNAGFGERLPARVLDDAQVSRWARDLVAPSTSWWVATLQDEIVGVVGVCPSRDPVTPGLGEVDTIAVRPAAWRQGIGRLLMERAQQLLEEAAYDHAILWTLADYPAGHAFYTALGWTPSGEVRDGGHEVAFRRTVREPVSRREQEVQPTDREADHRQEQG